MRKKFWSTTICIVLVFVGFLATPGLFDFTNPDYLLTLFRYQSALDKLAAEQFDVGKKIINASTSISKLESELQQNSAEATKKQFDMQLANASAPEIAKVAAEFGLKGNKLGIEIQNVKTYKERLETQQVAFKKTEAEINKKLESSKGETPNLYVASRALALGAIGALISIFAKFLSTTQSPIILDDRNAVARTAASMAMGAITAVVVVGLFFTGFISIFSTVEPASKTPDYWKITILCLLAGAFSERLFQAAAHRMEQYLVNTVQEPNSGKNDKSSVAQGDTGGKEGTQSS